MENYGKFQSIIRVVPHNLTDIVNGILRVTIHASQATSASKLSLVTSLILKEGIKFHNVIIKNEQRYVHIEIELIRRINIEEVVAVIQLRSNATSIKSKTRVIKSRWRVVYA